MVEMYKIKLDKIIKDSESVIGMIKNSFTSPKDRNFKY